MRVTVIPSDRKIYVDGEILELNFQCDANIHAIQWYGTYGVIELINGTGSKEINNIDDIQYFIDAFNVEKARLALEAEATNE